MATFNKFNCFVEDVAEGSHDFANDTLMVLLTNTAPNAADTLVDTTDTTCTVEATSNAAEIAAGNGYTKKGNAASLTTSSQTSGTYKLVLADPATWTASGGTIGPFQYAVLYNDTKKTTSTRPPIGWWNYGSAVTLQVGETFKVDFDAGTGVLTIA